MKQLRLSTLALCVGLSAVMTGCGDDDTDDGVNQNPLAEDDTATTDEDSAVDIAVLGNDSDPDEDTLIVADITQAAQGTVTINTDGTINYDPVIDFNGQDNFTYTVSDGAGGSATAVVGVTVGSVNDEPVAVGDNAATDMDTPIDLDVTANDTDVEDDELVVSAVDQTGSGAVEINLDGTVRFTPMPGALGNDTFGYTLSDGNGGTDDGAVTVNVTFPISRESVSTDEDQATDHSYEPATSADGRFVVFRSSATNLVATDTNGVGDIFIRDRTAGTTALVSVHTDGTQGDAASSAPAISADGRFVAFESAATNLVSSDTNGVGDVFVRDTLNLTTERISVSGIGGQANQRSESPAISADGRYVAFRSEATNLVTPDSGGFFDIYVYDRTNSTIERVSINKDGVQGDGNSGTPSITGDGNLVAFSSLATNLVAGDTNAAADIFVFNRTTNLPARVSVTTTGAQADALSRDPVIAADGRYVAFASAATNLIAGDGNSAMDIFVRDMQVPTTERVSVGSGAVEGNGVSTDPAISASGQFVAFISHATNLVPGDGNSARDAFVRDITGGETARVNIAADSSEADQASQPPALSSNGRYVCFESTATNLVPDDNNLRSDIFAARNPLVALP